MAEKTTRRQQSCLNTSFIGEKKSQTVVDKIILIICPNGVDEAFPVPHPQNLTSAPHNYNLAILNIISNNVQSHKAIPPPEAPCVHLAAGLSLLLLSCVALLPWPSRLTTQSIQLPLTLHRPFCTKGVIAHILWALTCALSLSAIHLCTSLYRIRVLYLMLDL